MIYIVNSKRIIEPVTKELINKTQLSPKIIPISSHRLGGSITESHFMYSTVVHLQPTTWKKPPKGKIKSNIDAAIFKQQQIFGAGICIREGHGRFLKAKTTW